MEVDCPAKLDRRLAGICFSHGAKNPAVWGGHIQEAYWKVSGLVLHIYLDCSLDDPYCIEFPGEISMPFQPISTISSTITY